MKKKICSSLILMIVIILGVTTVYADMIIPGQRFNKYEDFEKFQAFFEEFNSPIKEITAILFVFFIVLGLVLITLKTVETTENKNEKTKSVLQKIFLGITAILDLLSIYILKISLLFSNQFEGTIGDKWNNTSKINTFITIFYIIYAIVYIIALKISKKRNNKKLLYIITILLIIVLFVSSIFIVLNSDAGYYTYEKIPFFEQYYNQIYFDI